MLYRIKLRAGAASCGIILLSCGLSGCGTDSFDSVQMPPAPVTEMISTAQITTSTEQTETPAAPEADSAFQRNVTKKDGLTLIEGVPHFTQFEKYLTACESLSAVSLLQYYGIGIAPETFIEDCLPTAGFPAYKEDGILYGENPQDYFLGDPMEIDGYGCYSGAIVQAIDRITDGLAVSLNGKSLKWLCQNYIDAGEPVIIWATVGMEQVYEGNTWILPDGESFTFICPEHALVLIGYDDDMYYFCDSMQEDDVFGYDRGDVETAYQALGRMAVAIESGRLPDVPEDLRTDITEQPVPAPEEAAE